MKTISATTSEGEAVSTTIVQGTNSREAQEKKANREAELRSQGVTPHAARRLAETEASTGWRSSKEAIALENSVDWALSQ